MRSTRGLLAIIGAALTNQPTLAPDAGLMQYERRHDHGDRTQALIDEWNSMRIAANVAADFYTHSEKPFARKPRPGDPRQTQFHEQTFISAAAFFRRAGSDVAVGAADPARLSVITGDATTWLKVLRQQNRGRWDSERKLLFSQAVEALRIVSNEGGYIQNACDWMPLKILSFEVIDQRGDDVLLEVRIYNPNDIDSPIAALSFLLVMLSIRLIKWPTQKAFRGRKVTKTAFWLRRGDWEVGFARSADLQG